MAHSDAVRVIALLHGGHTVQDIAAITGATEAEVVATLRDPEASPALPSAGGGGSSVVHATDIPDQAVTLAHATGEPFPAQDLVAPLWTLEGGVWIVALWAEFNPVGDTDYFGLSLRGASVLMDSSISLGPQSRDNSAPAEVTAGGWIRGTGGGQPFIVMPSDPVTYSLQVQGFHYHDDDPGDNSTPVLGDVQLRNCRAIAVQLGA